MVNEIKYIFAYVRASHICDPANIKGLTKNAETAMVELLLVDDPHPVMEYSARAGIDTVAVRLAKMIR